MMFNTVFVQAQDESGQWRTYSVTVNDTIVILATMRSLKVRFPTYRVRTIDAEGRIIDIL
jgi:hypothetical protein